MKKIVSTITAALLCMLVSAQTLNIQVGEVTYQVPAAQLIDDYKDMVYVDGSQVTIYGKTFTIADIDKLYINSDEVTDNTVDIVYNGDAATVKVAGNAMRYLDVTADGAAVSISQHDDLAQEISYILSGSSDDGSFYMDGSYKASVVLNGITLTSTTGAPMVIKNGKRISIEMQEGTVNTFVDSEGGEQKACIHVKGHTELKGPGTLNITGRSAHAFWGKEYVEVKKTAGTINILGAVGDGFNVNQYFQMNGGTVNISGVGDDGIQVSYKTDDDDNIEEGDDNTGEAVIKGGTLTISTTGDAAKGITSEGDFFMLGGTVSISQTGSIRVEDDDISYATAIKSKGNIQVSGGTITVNNTAEGGKGLSADGTLTINENDATTVIDVKANGGGGVAENVGSGSGSGTTGSYKVYVSKPTSGGGGGGGSNAWSNVYLYKSDGTLVANITSNTATKSNGYQNTTFYYYDFGASDSGTYYFKSDDYTGRGWNSGTYTIQSATFTGPTSGSDVYYSIASSYTTSGSTRTYSLTNVTSSINSGTGSSTGLTGTDYKAMGIKADGDLTISGGTITVANSGAMSKSIKSKTTVTIDGGTVTLKPSGAMQIVNDDASYSVGVKATDFVMNDGTLDITATGTASRGISAEDKLTTNGGTITINNSGAGQTVSSENYTAKGMKGLNVALNTGTITIKMTGTGGKGIRAGYGVKQNKSYSNISGSYTQGTSDGNGPTLSVTTTGSTLGSSSSGGGGMGPGGMGGESSGSDAKAIKVIPAAVIYGGETEVYTSTNGAEGLESKVSITINGGKHYFKCYDDCINSSGKITFNGGVTVAHSNGNDAIDSNAGTTGAITIGNGVAFAYTSKGGVEEGFDCDNNSYIQITGTGIGISAGGSQGGGGGWGGSSSGNTISNAKQGYSFVTSSISYSTGRYYTLADASYNNLVTYSFEAGVSSNLALFTATGMVKGSTYNVRYSTTKPTDATTEWHGLYLGSSHKGDSNNQVTSFTAQ